MDLVGTFYSQIIPIGLWVVMLGMGLALTPSNFRNIFVMPKAITLGLLGQLVLLPVLAFVLAGLLAPTPAIAVGVVILAACPGGVTSNAYSFANRADVALSVSLTAVSSFVTILSVPLLTFLAMSTFLGDGVVIEVPVLEMMYTLAMLTVVPVGIGMVIRHFWSERAKRLVEAVRTASFLFLVFLIVLGTVVAFDTLREYFLQTVVVAGSLNVLSMAMGFGMGWLGRLNVAQRIAITYEVGVQNISLASLVMLSLLGREDFFVVPLVYAVIMKITALGFMYFARKWIAREEGVGNAYEKHATV